MWFSLNFHANSLVISYISSAVSEILQKFSMRHQFPLSQKFFLENPLDFFHEAPILSVIEIFPGEFPCFFLWDATFRCHRNFFLRIPWIFSMRRHFPLSQKFFPENSLDFFHEAPILSVIEIFPGEFLDFFYEAPLSVVIEIFS